LLQEIARNAAPSHVIQPMATEEQRERWSILRPAGDTLKTTSRTAIERSCAEPRKVMA